MGKWMECANCSTNTYSTYLYCPYCGTKLTKPEIKLTEDTEIFEFCHVFCTAAYNAIWELPKNGINNIKDLCSKSALEIYSIKGIGKSSLNNIIKALKEHGYSLRKMDNDATNYLKSVGIKL